MGNIISNHIKRVQDTLQSYYKLSTTSKHPGNKGYAREIFIKHFLSSNLPSNLDFTSGEVFDSKDNISPQMDIIIHRKDSIKLNIADNLNLIPVDTTLATIECKSILNKANLNQVLNSCVKLKKLHRINPVGMDLGFYRQSEDNIKNKNITIKQLLKILVVDGNSHQVKKEFPDVDRIVQLGDLAKILKIKTGMNGSVETTPYMLLAFEGKECGLLRNDLWSYMELNKIELELMPDIIAILDKNYYLAKNNGFFLPIVRNEDGTDSYVHYSEGKNMDAFMGAVIYLSKIAESLRVSQNFFPLKQYIAPCKDAPTPNSQP